MRTSAWPSQQPTRDRQTPGHAAAAVLGSGRQRCGEVARSGPLSPNTHAGQLVLDHPSAFSFVAGSLLITHPERDDQGLGNQQEGRRGGPGLTSQLGRCEQVAHPGPLPPNPHASQPVVDHLVSLFCLQPGPQSSRSLRVMIREPATHKKADAAVQD
jgi:hypothetical protein